MDTRTQAVPREQETVIPVKMIPNVEEAEYKRENLEVDKDIPVSLFESRYHKPYAAEFFGIKNNLLTALNNKEFEKLRTIDGFILEQIQRNELKDSQKSYNSIMNKLITLMGVDENSKPQVIIDKLLSIIALKNFLK